MALALWNAQQTVNTTTAGIQDQPHITQLTDGTMVVAWVDYSSGNQDVKFQRFDALGNKIGVETLAHGASASDQTACDITALSTGGYVISYWDVQANTLFAQKFAASGTLDGGAIALSNPPYLDLFGVPPRIQATQNGEFVVVYETNNYVTGTSGADLVGRVVNAAGVPQVAFSIATASAGNQYVSSITATGAGFVVAWYDEASSHTKLRIFSQTGTAFSAEVLLPDAAHLADIQFAPSITQLSNGNFVATWSDSTPTSTGTDIRGQVFTSSGAPFGSEFLAGPNQIGDQTVSKVIALADGKFMVIYSTSGFVGNNPLHAQMFNADGSSNGGDVLLTGTDSNSGAGGATIDAVTLADGRVAVVWPDLYADSANTGLINFGVIMQILDPREGVFNGTVGDDRIYGHDGNNDDFNGMGGNDTLWGLAGNDTLHGGDGSDTLDGGRGDDTLYGDAGNDMLIGDLGDDVLNGGSGDDTVSGGDGNDRIVISGLSPGRDAIDGGAGVDTLDLSAFTGSVWVDYNFQGDDVWSFSGGVWNRVADLTSVEKLIASSGDDQIRLDDADNVASGGAGNDLIYGRGGNDTLDGGAGNDKLFGEAGNDKLTADAGTDELYGGDGNDGFVFKGGAANGIDWAQGDAGIDTADFSGMTEKLWIDLTFSNVEAWTYIGGVYAGLTYLRGIENIVGSNLDDVMYGDANANQISGGGGADYILGRAGNDVLIGNDGNDRLFGGDGADTLSGDLGADELYGENGDDTFLFTGSGNAGRDWVDGGANSDTADFSGLSGFAWVDLTATGNEAWINYAGNWSVLAQLISVENMTGSQANDQFWGDANANIFIGGQGDDTMYGRGGIDTFKYTARGFGQDKVMDYVDGTDRLSFGSTVATDISNFTITGNGTNQVIMTLTSDPSSSVTLNGAAPITITNADIDFFV